MSSNIHPRSDRNIVPQCLHEWFDDPDTFMKTSDLKKKQFGSIDEDELERKFKEIDLRIHRRVNIRMNPRFCKSVTGTARIDVGFLSNNEYNLYLRQLSSSVRPSVVRERKLKIAGFHSYRKMRESIITASWKDSKFPHLSHKNHWFFTKWLNRGTNEVFRSYLTEFSIAHNSFTGSVRIMFNYDTAFYNERSQKWVQI